MSCAMSEDDTVNEAPDAGREALAAAKAAAMHKVQEANKARKDKESHGAATRRAAGSRAKRKSGGDRTDWEHPLAFGEAISEMLELRGWEGELAVARVLAEWPAIVGPDVAAKATPVGLVDGLLTLQAESTAWATQLRLLSPQLLEKIAARFGAGIVTKITARGPSGPQRPRGSLRSPDSRGPRDTYG